MNQNQTLSASSLRVALESIVAAESEGDCAAALSAAATLVQQAVREQISEQDFMESYSSCPQELSKVFDMVLRRAAGVHAMEDGSHLSLWLLPVVVDSNCPIAAHVRLNDSLNGLKFAALIKASLGLPGSGWVKVLPDLVSIRGVETAAYGDLLMLPYDARAYIRGERKQDVFFPSGYIDELPVAANTYFVPFVAYHPAGVSLDVAAPDERIAYRLTKWISETLQPVDGATLSITVAARPHPYSEGLTAGQRMAADTRLRQMVTAVREKSHIEFNGMAALVAPYITRHMAEGNFVLGVSLVSRLSGDFIASLGVQLDTDSPEAEIVEMASRVLSELGMQVIQLHHEPIKTIACQHCGRIQYALPDLEPSTALMPTNSKIH